MSEIPGESNDYKKIFNEMMATVENGLDLREIRSLENDPVFSKIETLHNSRQELYTYLSSEFRGDPFDETHDEKIESLVMGAATAFSELAVAIQEDPEIYGSISEIWEEDGKERAELFGLISPASCFVALAGEDLLEEALEWYLHNPDHSLTEAFDTVYYESLNYDTKTLVYYVRSALSGFELNDDEDEDTERLSSPFDNFHTKQEALYETIEDLAATFRPLYTEKDTIEVLTTDLIESFNALAVFLYEDTPGEAYDCVVAVWNEDELKRSDMLHKLAPDLDGTIIEDLWKLDAPEEFDETDLPPEDKDEDQATPASLTDEYAASLLNSLKILADQLNDKPY